MNHQYYLRLFFAARKAAIALSYNKNWNRHLQWHFGVETDTLEG